MIENKFDLFTTNIGSHMWKMQHEKSDIDLAVVYLMDSRAFLLGKRVKGKQVQKGEYDYTYYEIGNVVNDLLKGNVNYIWAIMSPIIISEHRSSLKELKNIFMCNISKNCYNSINGLAKHNIHHFIDGGDKQSFKYRKKLNVIGRTLKFGINLLTWGKCLFDKTEITNDEELWELKQKLDIAYNNSTLPEKPNSEPFENYLIKLRIHKMKKDGII